MRSTGTPCHLDQRVADRVAVASKRRLRKPIPHATEIWAAAWLALAACRPHGTCSLSLNQPKADGLSLTVETKILAKPGLRDLRPQSVALVVPVYNERDNVLAFYSEAASALAELDWQIIFVDDNSPDGTAAIAEELAIDDRRVQVIVRFHQRGLTSAVLQGVCSANTSYVVVTDADLQHDL
jgi:hypothetical protein